LVNEEFLGTSAIMIICDLQIANLDYENRNSRFEKIMEKIKSIVNGSL